MKVSDSSGLSWTRFGWLAALCVALSAGCNGGVASGGVSNPPPGGSGGSGGENPINPGDLPPLNPGTVTVPPVPFEPTTAQASVRKVKNLLTGLPPTDSDVQTVTAMGAAGLQALIATWMNQPAFKEKFRERMLFFFRNAFQQTGFNPAEDFKPQLLTNGGFDFPTTPGDDIFPRLVQNLEDSFALTAWHLMAEGRAFSEVLTTRRFMMTTALKATYLQIEMPRDARGAATPTVSWKVDESGIDIPIEQIVDPASPNYLTFADRAPVTGARAPTLLCRGTPGMVNPYTGYTRLFQVLLGMVPTYSTTVSGVNTTVCDRHSSRPYFTVEDVSDWQWVTIRPLNVNEARIMPYDIPALRKATELAVALPRVGFFTTPAFLALWNTNDSNQHRVTANQTLLVALGRSVLSSAAIIPLSAAGLDANHAVDGSECYACHKTLDPLRQFWGTQFDFNDRNDFPGRASFGLAANPRPTTTGGGFAFGNVNATGAAISDLGPLITQVMDMATDPPVNRFAMTVAQKLCFFANSTECLEQDPEFRRIAAAFESSSFNFASLLKELLSSPLVTGAKPTLTSEMVGHTVSIARRDQLCTSLSNRLGKPDLCGLTVPVPSPTQAATLKIATSVPADAFSRGDEFPITASEPTLFYSAACEMLCENVAAQVVDAAVDSVFSSTNPGAAIADMVQKVMGYPPSDPAYQAAVDILQADYNANVAKLGARPNVTNALRSTFALACQSPTSLSFGL